MYNINLSFLSGTVLEEETIEKVTSKYNNVYKKLITTTLTEENPDEICESCCFSEDIAEILDENVELLEVECKGLLCDKFCLARYSPDQELEINDMVIIQADESVEIARILNRGEVVNLKCRQLGINFNSIPEVIRKATSEDMVKLNKNISDELRAIPIFKEKVEKFTLIMKLVDIHYQFDRKKLFFFYTSDGRVDFRELARELAAEFKTRIELRQIGVRDEAKRMGGIGTCGREFCCTSFLNNFKRITTQLANEQNLSSNMAKLSGPCGKLKCCLSFEMDFS